MMHRVNFSSTSRITDRIIRGDIPSQRGNLSPICFPTRRETDILRTNHIVLPYLLIVEAPDNLALQR